MIPRIYNKIVNYHLENYRQMIFLSGPRQVGKTTIAKQVKNISAYINWDVQEHRTVITSGPYNVIEKFSLNNAEKVGGIIVFDELHKYTKWRDFLKGFFDIYGEMFKIIVTGSSRLNVFKKSGDSLMGRYFSYTVYPLSIGELSSHTDIENEIREPKRIEEKDFKKLLDFGGFPEPFIKSDKRFYRRWLKIREEIVYNEDLRDLSRVHELKLIRNLAQIYASQAGSLVNYMSLAKTLNVSVDSIKRWSEILASMYIVFFIRPYFKNIPKSLRKQPKVYLWDWSVIKDKGAKYENFIATHLLKAVAFWNDLGFGDYKLFFLRDKEKREVDFLVTKNDEPWLMVEVKTSKLAPISEAFKYFKEKLNPFYALQVNFEDDFSSKNCFYEGKIIKASVKSFLSQLP